MRTITIQDFQKKLAAQAENELNIIDVRAPEAFAEAHIKGAQNIPLDELENHLDQFDQDKEYYIICYSGMFSQQATNFLNHHGFTAISIESGMNYILNQ